jgi:uncharacterized protein (DUF1501 family)
MNGDSDMGTDPTFDGKSRSNGTHRGEELGLIPSLSRRQLLGALGLSSAAVVAGCSSNSSSESSSTPSTETSAAQSKGTQAKANGSGSPAKSQGSSARKQSGKVLVVVELQGGMDGFASLVPYGDGAFRKLRDRIWIDEKDLTVMDDKYALAKGLAPVKDRLAFIEGVGVANPDLSHFEMMRRWWLGDLDGKDAQTTGFLGRCCDQLVAGEPITGISIGGGSSPALIAEKAATVALPALDLTIGLAKSEPEEDRLRKSLRLGATEGNGVTLGNGDEPDRLAAIARASMNSGLDLIAHFSKLGEKDKRYPEGNELAAGFQTVRQLISLDVGMQIFHIPWGSFDTHADQIGNHSGQMDQFGIALAAFLDDLKDKGLSDRVVVATTSEFGRRPEANGNGTDHGTASTMMLAGAVKPGRHGVAPNFAKLNEEGNVKATVSLDDYYATLAQGWLGVPTSEVLGKRGNVIDNLLTA